MIDQKTLDEFSKIYDETYNDVLRYVVCKCSNISDVEDIIQNIYLDVYKKLPNISKCLFLCLMCIKKHTRHGMFS